MNRKEYLLACLSEEAVELAQSAHKALRFGLENGTPIKGLTNATTIGKEMTDVYAVIQLLKEDGHIDWEIDTQDIMDKKAKIAGYMEHSKNIGVLSETSPGV